MAKHPSPDDRDDEDRPENEPQIHGMQCRCQDCEDDKGDWQLECRRDRELALRWFELEDDAPVSD